MRDPTGSKAGTTLAWALALVHLVALPSLSLHPATRRWSCSVLVLCVVACKSPPADDPDAVDWTSYQEARTEAVAPEPPPAPPSGPRSYSAMPNREPPPGYSEVMRPDWFDVGAGITIFTASYLPPALIATQAGGTAWTMQVPLVGPLIQLGYTVEFMVNVENPAYGNMTYIGLSGLCVLLAALSVVQTSGVVLATLGFTQQKPVWLRNDLALVDQRTFAMRLRFSGSALELKGRF